MQGKKCDGAELEHMQNVAAIDRKLNRDRRLSDLEREGVLALTDGAQTGDPTRDPAGDAVSPAGTLRWFRAQVITADGSPRLSAATARLLPNPVLDPVPQIPEFTAGAARFAPAVPAMSTG